MRVAIGLRLESDEDWQKATTYVVEAERLGVDFVWSHESWGLDAAGNIYTTEVDTGKRTQKFVLRSR